MVNQKIRKIRLFKNLTQEHLAERLGVSLKTYQKMEGGETPVSVNRLDKIAEVFDMKSSSILDLPDDTQSFYVSMKTNNGAVGGNNHFNSSEIEALKNHIQSLEAQVKRLEEDTRFQKELIAKLIEGKA